MLDITLSIHCLPDLDLSANRRRSRVWQAQWQDTKKERFDAGLVLASARRALWDAGVESLTVIPLTPPIDLHWTLFWPKGMRARDADGCADLLKPWQDAMVDLGWLKTDAPRYVGSVTYECIPGSSKGPSMQLVISKYIPSV